MKQSLGGVCTTTAGGLTITCSVSTTPCAILNAPKPFGLHSGDAYLSSGTGEVEVERAEDEGDYIYLAYGRRSLPRDVPPSTRPPLPRVGAPLGPDGRPPGFVSTGDAFHDKLIIDQYRLFYLDPSRAQRSAPPKPIPPIPPFPALPAVPGFTPTGDPALDEPALFLHVSEHGTPAQLEEV